MDSFITAAQLFDRLDWRWIAKNILDGPSASTSIAPPSLADLLDTNTVAGARLYQLMKDASEKLMGAAAIGARYTVDELTQYGGNLLVSTVAGLSIGPILSRRTRAVSDEKVLNAMYTEAVEYVEQLRRGERIFFQVPDVPEAGLPESADMAPGPLAPPNFSAQASRYFGCPAANDGVQSNTSGGGCGTCGGGFGG